MRWLTEGWIPEASKRTWDTPASFTPFATQRCPLPDSRESGAKSLGGYGSHHFLGGGGAKKRFPKSRNDGACHAREKQKGLVSFTPDCGQNSGRFHEHYLSQFGRVEMWRGGFGSLVAAAA